MRVGKVRCAPTCRPCKVRAILNNGRPSVIAEKTRTTGLARPRNRPIALKDFSTRKKLRPEAVRPGPIPTLVGVWVGWVGFIIELFSKNPQKTDKNNPKNSGKKLTKTTQKTTTLYTKNSPQNPTKIPNFYPKKVQTLTQLLHRKIQTVAPKRLKKSQATDPTFTQKKSGY